MLFIVFIPDNISKEHIMSGETAEREQGVSVVGMFLIFHTCKAAKVQLFMLGWPLVGV